MIEFGSPEADHILIQMVDDHDLAGIRNEVEEIRKRTERDFRMIAVKVVDWNRDLSPWKAPAVFGREDFGDGAEETLARILPITGEAHKTYYIGGYSLAGLFALWAAHRTDVFSGVAAASPSVWFPGFTEHMKENRIRTEAVYLSLGDREEKARNPVMATVGDKIREAEGLIQSQGIRTTLEWNPGNHFQDADKRTAKAFAWLLRQS